MTNFGESFTEHQGVTLSCRNVAPGLTLHDLAVAFEKAKRKAKPGDEFAGDPSKWPDVCGIKAVVDKMNAAYATRDSDTRPKDGDAKLGSTCE